MLDPGERVLETRRNGDLLEKDREDVPLPLAGQHDLLGYVVRAAGRLRNHQEEDLCALECVDDRLAPERRTVDSALIDPDTHTRRAQLRHEVENAILVLTGIADEYVGRLTQR